MAVVIDKYRWQWEIWSDDAIYLMMMKRIAIIERTMIQYGAEVFGTAHQST